jgi:hypothetical protein
MICPDVTPAAKRCAPASCPKVSAAQVAKTPEFGAAKAARASPRSTVVLPAATRASDHVITLKKFLTSSLCSC